MSGGGNENRRSRSEHLATFPDASPDGHKLRIGAEHRIRRTIASFDLRCRQLGHDRGQQRDPTATRRSSQ